MDVHEALDLQLIADARGVIDDGVDLLLAQRKAGVDGHRIATVYACPLHMFHDAWNQHRLTVANGVHLNLAALEVLVDKHPPSHASLECVAHVAHQLRGVLHDLHGAAPKHVAGPDQNRIANLLGHIQRLLQVGHGGTRWVGNAYTSQELFEELSVGGSVDGLGGGAENR